MLTEVIRRYQRYDPLTGGFSVERSQGEYARLLGVSPAIISLVLNEERDPGIKLIHALVRIFPAAADDIANALRAQPVEAAS